MVDDKQGWQRREGLLRLESATRQLFSDTSDAGLADFEHAALLMEQVGDKSLQAHALLGAGHALSSCGRREESLTSFGEAIRLFADCDDTEKVVECEAARLEALIGLQRWDANDRSGWILRTVPADAAPDQLVYRVVALRYEVLAALAREDYETAAGQAIEAADLGDRFGDSTTDRQRLAAAHWLLSAGHGTEAAELYLKLRHRARASNGDIAATALEGLATALEASPEIGVGPIRAIVRQHAASRDLHLEAVSRQQLARCLRVLGHEARAESANEFDHAGRLFDRLGRPADTAECWRQAANSFLILGLLDTTFLERSATTAQLAAERFEKVGNWWGKGLSESVAVAAIRMASPAGRHDERLLMLLERSADSFRRAGRPLEEAATQVLRAAELSLRGDDGWIDIAIGAVDTYEAGRPSLRLPHQRAAQDYLLAQGIRILTSRLHDAADSSGRDPRWAQLVWALACRWLRIPGSCICRPRHASETSGAPVEWRSQTHAGIRVSRSVSGSRCPFADMPWSRRYTAMAILPLV